MSIQQFMEKYRKMPLYPILGCATYVYFIYFIIYMISYDGMWGIFGALMSSGKHIVIYAAFELLVAILNLICCFILKDFQTDKETNKIFDIGAIIGLAFTAPVLLALVQFLFAVKG